MEPLKRNELRLVSLAWLAIACPHWLTPSRKRRHEAPSLIGDAVEPRKRSSKLLRLVVDVGIDAGSPENTGISSHAHPLLMHALYTWDEKATSYPPTQESPRFSGILDSRLFTTKRFPRRPPAGRLGTRLGLEV